MQLDGREMGRNLIPRWRPVGRSVQLGEASPAEKSAETSSLRDVRHVGLTRAMDEFRKNRTTPYAAEVVAVAVVEGVPEKAQEAARFLANCGEDLAVTRRLIDSCLGLASDQDAPTSRALQRKTSARSGSRAPMFVRADSHGSTSRWPTRLADNI